MRLLAVIFAITVFLSVSISAQPKSPIIKPEKTYKQSGVKMVSPNQTGWQIIKSEKLETVFGKTNSEAEYKVFARTKTIPDYENTNDLLKSLEAMKQAELNDSNRDSLHYNYQKEFNETPCVQYDGIFKNDAAEAPGYKYFNFYGYICQHPSDKNIVIQMEFSDYSNTRGFSEAEFNLRRDFFEKIKFVKVKKD